LHLYPKLRHPIFARPEVIVLTNKPTNKQTLRSGLCYHLSVCLSVTSVRPTQEVETFGNITLPFCALAIASDATQLF